MWIANDWGMKFGAHELGVGAEHEKFCLHLAAKDVDLPEVVTSERCQSSAMQPYLFLDRSRLAMATLDPNRQQTGRAETE